MEYIKISESNRECINEFIMKNWFTTTMILRGKEIDMTKVEGIFVLKDNDIIGLVTFVVNGLNMEITSLDSLHEKQGIGSTLMRLAEREALDRNCSNITLITTNDNINALRFYQKRGYDMVHLFHNALDVSRKMKPEIPLIGENDIPLRHEIEFEKIIGA